MKGSFFVRRISILALALWVIVAAAASPPDPDIVFVASEGYWQHNGRGGHFRVIVRRLGFEHVGSQVIAEWVAEPSSPDQPYRIVSTTQLQGAFLGSLGVPQLTPGQN